MKNFFGKIKSGIERYIPMTLDNLLIFTFLLYLVFVVGRSIIINHQADEQIVQEQVEVNELRSRIQSLEYQINYYKTDSFREKEARAKLGYKAAGESVVVLPIDTPKDKSPDPGIVSVQGKAPNYVLWKRYFFGD